MNAELPAAPLPLAELLTLARQHEQAERLEEAERVLRRILASLPTQLEALHSLGILAYKAARFQEARCYIEAAIEHGTHTPLYFRNIAEVYRKLGRHEDARRAAYRGAALNPSDPLALINLGIVLADQLKLDEAIGCFEQALAVQPDAVGAHFGLAEALLMQGDFERGWDQYEWRFRMPDASGLMPNTDRPRLEGGALPDGRLLLIADQGFGDSIQFGRYIPWAAERCATLLVACSPPLQPLLAQLHHKVDARTRWDQIADYAAWSPLTSLPRLAGTRLSDIPAVIPYLHADPPLVERWVQRLDVLAPRGFRRVGTVWAGRPAHKNDQRRSLALKDLAPLTDVDGVAVVVLQKGAAQRQVGQYYGRAPLIHLSAEVNDFADTMAIIDRLDLVITVDTSVAHLAGAMGKPVWIMLPWAAEWRWLLNRVDSP